MRNFKTLLLSMAFMTAFFFVSCDSDDDNGNDVNFLNSYLSQTGFDESVESVTDIPYEFGVLFHVTQDGEMSKIRVRIPEDNDNLRVTVWNVLTETPIRTEEFSVNGGQAKTFDIDDLNLTANTSYAITMNSDSWYVHTRDDAADVTYPVTVESVVIDGYAFASGTDQAFPTVPAAGYYAGDLSFTFDPD